MYRVIIVYVNRVLMDIILIKVLRLNMRVKNVVRVLDRMVVIIGIFVFGCILVRNFLKMEEL